MQRFTKLEVWQRSHQLALSVYRLTRTFPTDERFGIVSQIRRAVVSVASNIAEGSLAETESLLHLARDLECGPAEILTTLITETEEIARMVYALREAVETAAERHKHP